MLYVFLPQDVGILINGSVPDLIGSRVECEYEPGVSTVATVHLDSGPSQIQTCPLLPRKSYQPILPGKGGTANRQPFGFFFFAKLPAMFFHTFQGQLWYLSHFFIRTNPISPFISSKSDKVSVTSGCTVV